jgi:GTPase SAR1 family protein
MESSDGKYDYFRITMVGDSATGKTSICNRLVNNFFPVIYEPTLKEETYALFFDLSEIQIKKHCLILIEDMFGLNNPLLSTNDKLTCEEQTQMKTYMTGKFKEIMFTSSAHKDKGKNTSTKKGGEEKDNKLEKKELLHKIWKKEHLDFPRKGFVFVCDANDDNSVDDIIFTIERLREIEKTNNMEMKYPKLILINKKDKVDSQTIKKIIKKIKDKFSSNSNIIDIQEVSALTNEGIIDSFKSFMSKIQQLDVESKQNNGYQENELEEEDERNTVCII